MRNPCCEYRSLSSFSEAAAATCWWICPRPSAYLRTKSAKREASLNSGGTENAEITQRHKEISLRFLCELCVSAVQDWSHCPVSTSSAPFGTSKWNRLSASFGSSRSPSNVKCRTDLSNPVT